MKFAIGTLNLIALAAILSVSASSAQDLGQGFHKIKDGIYTFAPDQTTTTCSFVVTQEGVVVIDSCNNPLQSRNLLAAIRKVTDMPVLFLINTETHGDHSGNNFVFSPPAMIINAEGAGAAMKKAYNPKRAAQQAAQSAEMAEAVKGEKLMVPHIEYNEKMTLNVGERSFDLIYLKNVHSEADTAVWMPKERVLFAA